MKARICTLILLLCKVSMIAYCQNIFVTAKSNEKKGDYYAGQRAWSPAIKAYSKALKKNKSNKKTLYIKLARCYEASENTQQAIRYYENAFKEGYVPSSKDSNQYAELLFRLGMYDKARQWIPKVILNTPNTTGIRRLEEVNSFKLLYQDTACYKIHLLPINSPYRDIACTVRDSLLLLTSDRPSAQLSPYINLQTDNHFFQLYFSCLKDSSYRQAIPLYSNKHKLHVGTAVFMNNEKKIIFSANAPAPGSDDKQRLLMYIADWDNNTKTWENARPTPFSSYYYSVAQPAISRDNRTIYFSSDMAGGMGGKDLYKVHYENGEWSAPINLKAPINTPGDEMFPYISPSGKFYFASTGHGGLGGLDIFTIEENHSIPIVKNLGAPINSSEDDYAILLSEDEKSGFFTSNRPNGYGLDDIYAFKKIEHRLDFSVKDILSKKLLPTHVILTDEETGQFLPVSFDSTQHHPYTAMLKPNRNYKLIVQKEDYTTGVKEISTYGLKMNESIKEEVFLKHRYDYYVNVKIRDEATEDLADSIIVMLINLNNGIKDSLGVFHKRELTIKLDTETEYLLVAYNKLKSGYLYLEKQQKRKVSFLRYLSLIVADIKTSSIKGRISGIDGNTEFAPITLNIKNMITGESFDILTQPDGEFSFTLSVPYYFRIYTDKKNYYNSLNKVTTGGFNIKLLESDKNTEQY
ncbi:MAG: hypothetical protein NZ529_02475 [Cytophagaceae bacterium]|nr:hypothetical protein [Cytophagaceae bacterium]MDW8455635.1 hypothetical protein [Cytophagaceae bacterium]